VACEEETKGAFLLVTNPFIREENGNIRISATFPGILLQRYLEGGSHMCTSITWKNGDFYFGRNMDLEYSFGECVTVTPRRFPFRFRYEGALASHYAMIGMAAGETSFPLYAEAVNEKGLCMAGLNFPGNAYYGKAAEGKANAAVYELVPWLLGTCASVEEAEEKLSRLNLTDDAFSENMPPAPLHWMLADRERCLVIEPVREGMDIYEDPVGVLTNNPSFEYHRTNLNNYLNVTAQYPRAQFLRPGGTGGAAAGEDGPDLKPYSQGMGGIGLPGDFSSSSRFVKAAFLKWNCVCGKSEEENVSQFFHILDGVAMPRGAVITQDGNYDITTYSCCVNADTGIYYYKTYGNSQIAAVDMRGIDLDGDRLTAYPMETGQVIRKVN